MVGDGFESPSADHILGDGFESPCADHIVGGGFEPPSADHIDGGGFESPSADHIDGYLHKVEDTFLAKPREEQRLSERVACVSLSLVPLGHLPCVLKI